MKVNFLDILICIKNLELSYVYFDIKKFIWNICIMPTYLTEHAKMYRECVEFSFWALAKLVRVFDHVKRLKKLHNRIFSASNKADLKSDKFESSRIDGNVIFLETYFGYLQSKAQGLSLNEKLLTSITWTRGWYLCIGFRIMWPLAGLFTKNQSYL